MIDPRLFSNRLGGPEKNWLWEDVDFEKGTIRWRAEHDKIRQTWVVPMHREVRAELIQLRKRYPWDWPLPALPSSPAPAASQWPVTRHLAAWWLREAFRRGGLEKPAGSSGTHSDASGRPSGRICPLKDVAAVGGWRDTSTLLRYQQPDEVTMARSPSSNGCQSHRWMRP